MKSKSGFRKKFRGILFFILVIVFLLDLLRFSTTLFLVSEGQPYKPGESVDMVAVLTGGQGRFKEAFSFLQTEQGRVLFISGIDEGVTLSDVLKANGVQANPEEFIGRIYVDRVAKSTQENAIEIRKIAEWLGVKSVLVVTSSYHMRRSMQKIAREVERAPALGLKLFSWSVESPNFDRELWWQSFTGWRILLSEYFKSRGDDFFQI